MGAVVLGRLTEVPRSRLLGWTILVTVLAALSYAANLGGGDPPKDVLYQWTTAVGGLVQYAIILAVVLLLSRGIAPATLGLRRPDSWARAAGWIVAALVAVWVIGAILNVFLKAGEEQGLVPDGWDSSRAAPFVANFVVVGARRRPPRADDLRRDPRVAAPSDGQRLPDDDAARAVQRDRPHRGGDGMSSFDELRAQIAENDREIVARVNARLRLVAELWRLKEEQGALRLDPDREARLRRALAAANEGPLTPAGLERLVGELLALTKDELGGA
jgi:chorismate mutase